MLRLQSSVQPCFTLYAILFHFKSFHSERALKTMKSGGGEVICPQNLRKKKNNFFPNQTSYQCGQKGSRYFFLTFDFLFLIHIVISYCSFWKWSTILNIYGSPTKSCIQIRLHILFRIGKYSLHSIFECGFPEGIRSVSISYI